jgi:hypothetical protein
MSMVDESVRFRPDVSFTGWAGMYAWEGRARRMLEQIPGISRRVPRDGRGLESILGVEEDLADRGWNTDYAELSLLMWARVVLLDSGAIGAPGQSESRRTKDRGRITGVGLGIVLQVEVESSLLRFVHRCEE